MAIPGMGQFVQPEIVSTHFHIREGDKVGDFGAGSGFFSKVLSKLVGASGRVYACEIQKPLVDKLGLLVRSERLSNVEVLWCDVEASGGTKLADGLLDAGVLVNTLFILENKEVALREIARVMRKGGKFFLIEWTESFGGIGPHPSHVVHETTARSLAEAAGFSFERSFPAGDHHYGISFRKV